MVFFGKKQPKLTKNEENWQNPNSSIKFSEIWYVNASQQKKILQKYSLRFCNFYVFFGQKMPKLTKYDKNWQNPDRVIKLSEIRYVNASQQKKIQQKNYFSILPFFVIFC